MCELFAVNASKKRVLNETLKAFFSNACEHPNGWGMAFFYGGGVSVEKQPENALDSTYLKQRLRARIEADRMMAHIRLATKGGMEYENTHPFVRRDSDGRAWTFAHNGTIFECDVLRDYLHVQEGQTDSERILMYLTDRMEEARRRAGRPLSARERFAVTEEVTAEITPENKVNFILYDGELLYVHANFRGSLHLCREEGAVTVSTRPLDQRFWEEVPLNTLLAFRNGEQVFEGQSHGNEFFFSEEKMKLLFLDFAAL